MRFFRKYCFIAATILVSACSTMPDISNPSDTQTPQVTSNLNNTRWKLINATDSQGKRIDAFFVQSKAPIELVFTDKHFAIENACNILNGSWQINHQQTITFYNTLSTKMLCSPELNKLEQLVIEHLHSVEPVKITFNDAKPSTMSLHFSNGNGLVFEKN